jgi:hypothetical protein
LLLAAVAAEVIAEAAAAVLEDIEREIYPYLLQRLIQ